MPKSKRARIVHLSKVDKKGKELQEKTYNAVREASDAYPYIYIFAVENMRNNYLKQVRKEFLDGKIFFSKTKVMAKALGTDTTSEYLPGLSSLTSCMKGNVGILFTSRAPEDVLAFFSSYSALDFARAGVVAPSTFTIPAGTVYSTGGQQPIEDDVPVPHSVESTLRKWGMPTKMVMGKVMLDSEYTICHEGRELSSHQTSLLKNFGVAMAVFKIRVLAYWQAANGIVTEVESIDHMQT